MPVDRAGMLKTPVNRDPARPPGLEAQLLGAHGVAAELEDVEILPGENVPVAIQKRPAQMFRQLCSGLRFVPQALGISIRAQMCPVRVVAHSTLRRLPNRAEDKTRVSA